MNDASQQQFRIALDTLSMGAECGMTKDQARAYLASQGYTEDDVARVEKRATRASPSLWPKANSTLDRMSPSERAACRDAGRF